MTLGVSGFRSQYLVLAKHARFRLRQYPMSATPGGFEPPRAEPTHLAGEPLNHSGKVSRAARSGNTAAQKNSFVETKNKKRKYACRDSNSGFPACEAGVITRLDHTRTPRQPWRVRCRNPHLHCDQKKENSPTGIRTRVVWVKTTYPDQLDYWGVCAGRESNPGLVRGRDVYYHCTTGACIRTRI